MKKSNVITAQQIGHLENVLIKLKHEFDKTPTMEIGTFLRSIKVSTLHSSALVPANIVERVDRTRRRWLSNQEPSKVMARRWANSINDLSEKYRLRKIAKNSEILKQSSYPTSYPTTDHEFIPEPIESRIESEANHQEFFNSKILLLENKFNYIKATLDHHTELIKTLAPISSCECEPTKPPSKPIRLQAGSLKNYPMFQDQLTPRIDPYTGEEFIPARINQNFALPENRQALQNYQRRQLIKQKNTTKDDFKLPSNGQKEFSILWGLVKLRR